jgi:hypothetical protein
VQSFQTNRFPSALACLAVAVERFGAANAHAQSTFKEILSIVCQSTFQYIQEGHPPADCPELVKAFFDMGYRYSLFCPGALFAAPELPTMFELCVACVGNQER